MKYSKPKNFNSFEKNSRWLDGHKAVRRLAFLRYKLKKICNKCSSRKEIVVHHKNKDRTNNSKENLEILCNSCHNSYHKKEVNGINLRHSKIKVWSKYTG